MRYFTYMAEQAFKTSESGERLFYRGGFWSRPYIVPDAATEQRLYRKQVLLLRWTLGPLILGQPFLFVALDSRINSQPLWFLTYLTAVIFTFWFIGRLTFRRELKSLQRAQSRLPVRSFFCQMAQKHSRTRLVLRLLACLLFVVASGWLLRLRTAHAPGFSHLVSALCMTFFGLLGVLWGYALYLNLTNDTPTE